VQRQGFGGKVAGRTWGAPKEHGPRINLVRMEEELSAVHLRLSRVTIENMDWLDFVLRYDKQETVFYLDPPHYNMPYYKHNFYSLKDFEVLAEAMMRLKGKFILSINDHADIRRTFGSFKIRSVKVGYAIGPKRKTGKELLVRNF
jgi:DNA adenine methylase